MKKKSTKRTVFIAAVLCAAVLIIGAVLMPRRTVPRGAPAAGTAEFHFIDVGQGDAIFIRTSEGNVLVDTGSNAAEEELRQYLSAFRVRRLDYLVITHPDEDHAGGADMILREFSVGAVLTSVTDPSLPASALAYDTAAKTGIPVYGVEAGQSVSVGRLVLKILSPGILDDAAENDLSVVLRAEYDSISVLLQGDAEGPAEQAMLEKWPPQTLKCDVLKVGHHGSLSSSSEAWLSAVSPAFAVISCGSMNSYGHPHPTVLARLRAIGAETVRTDLSGSVVFLTDGQTLTLLTDKK